MRFPGIRSVEQTEQKFRRFESVSEKKRKKKQLSNNRVFLLIEAPSKNG